MAVPRQNEPFYHYATNFVNRLAPDPTVYGVTAAQLTTLTGLFDVYDSAFTAEKAAREGGTVSSPLIAARNVAKGNLLAYIRELYAMVQANSSISDEKKIELGVHIPDRNPTPSPVPAKAPRVVVTNISGRTVDVRLEDVDDSERKRLPEHVDGAIIVSHVGPEAPTDPNLYAFQLPVGRRTATLQFDNSLPPGTVVWISALWFNGRKAIGPACAPVKAILTHNGDMASSA